MSDPDRRHFLTASAATAALALSGESAAAAPADQSQRECYELRRYVLDDDAQREGFDRFMREAAIPALNRLGIEPVGVFHKPDGRRPAFVLLRHRSIDSSATMTERLIADQEFLSRGASFINAPADRPAYKRFTTSLLLAFRGMPHLETPVTAPDRVIQLRIYESHSVRAGQKKIEMFNDAGEIRIFREVGLHPVFFGEAIAGPRMPNLTYMLMFENDQQRQANWGKFGNHPDWQRLRAMPEYADRAIVSHITNLLLKPAEYSQI